MYNNNELKDKDINEISLQQITSNPSEIIEMYYTYKFVFLKCGIDENKAKEYILYNFRESFRILFGNKSKYIPIEDIKYYYV